MLQSNTQLERYIFDQVTHKQRRFETCDATEIYNATFEIVPYSNNSLTEEMFANIQTRKVQKQFVIMMTHVTIMMRIIYDDDDALLSCYIAVVSYGRQVPGRVVVKFGRNPGESIVDLAIEEQASMVVLGTRGLGAIRRTILGSVSTYVLHHAHCPVVVCNHGHQQHHSAVSS